MVALARSEGSANVIRRVSVLGTMPPDAPTEGAAVVGSAIALSVFGAAVHTVREFGVAALLAPSSGFLPVVLVQALLFLLWWRSRRRGTLVALALSAALQLVGGAFLSVLPLPILPFEPEQTVAHYLSHVVFGVCQVPLALLPWLRRPR